jgi:hypothetical protein
MPPPIEREVWLRSNRRVLTFALVPPLLMAVLGTLLISDLPRFESAVAYYFGWGLIVLGGLLAGMILGQFRQPRLVYEPGHLLVYLKSGAPYTVPIDVVEAFFLTQGPAQVPGRRDAETKTKNLSIRIAERAKNWSQRDVKPALGRWCDGYIAFRGTWCEPLSLDLVQRLNRRLGQVTRAERAGASDTPPIESHCRNTRPDCASPTGQASDTSPSDPSPPDCP